MNKRKGVTEKGNIIMIHIFSVVKEICLNIIVMMLKVGKQQQKVQKLFVHTAPILEKPPQVPR
jgi:hypothetical protein